MHSVSTKSTRYLDVDVLSFLSESLSFCVGKMVFSSVNVFIALYDQCFCTDEFVPWAADGYRDPYMNQAVVHLTVCGHSPIFILMYLFLRTLCDCDFDTGDLGSRIS